MRKLNTFDLITWLYLYLPIIIFGVSWLNPLLGWPLTLVIVYMIWRGSFQPTTLPINWKKNWPYLLIALGGIICWALLSGLGGHFLQSYDWQKHNVLLNDFISKSWPVHYHFAGKHGVVSYYIAEYLIPALVGKLGGFDAAQNTLLIWIVIGLALLVLSIYKWVSKDNGYVLLLILFSLILFSPFIYPLTGIYANWAPMDAGQMGEIGEWFSKTLKLQYTSNISLLRFVFPQFVPIALAVSIWLRNRYNYRLWGLILVPTVLYSTFTFLGLSMVMVLTVVADLLWKKGRIDWKKVFSLDNILAIIVILILVLYICCNILQPKPADEQMRFAFIDVGAHKLAFITFQAAWIIWILLLLKHEWRNSLLYIASLVLMTLPFFEYGAANDLVMRVSIPSLMIINLLVIKNIALYLRSDTYYAMILIGALVIAGSGPLWQLKSAAVNHNIRHHSYNMPYQHGNDFFKSDKNVVYQYVDWHESKLGRFIIRK